MARSRRQARRSGGGNEGLPGWAWLMMGVVVTIAVIMIAPKYFKADHDGFFRPRPNPDAEPAAVAVADEGAMADDQPAPKKKRAGDAADPVAEPAADKRKQDYDFYTLLPGKEVPVTDAEIAATERAEEERRQRREAEAMARSQAAANAAVEAAATSTASAPEPLPEPVVEAAIAADPRVPSTPPAVPATKPSVPSTTAATAAKTAPTKPVATSVPADDGIRYLLQAGAFQASGQAEELKARIALLGLGARVESAQIAGKTVYRVRMGPYGSAGDLAEAKRKLGNGGLAAMAIKVN